MGRLNGKFHDVEDNSQRAKRKKNIPSGEKRDLAITGAGPSEEKRGLYHCNYCDKDISGKIRIKCNMCSDFDLCIECFSVGAEVYPHKSNHPYRVMEVLSFPLISPDWDADEEILLLEAIDTYGMGNWEEVSDHVGTKTKESCFQHFTNAYLNSPYFPFPDMSCVIGKNKTQLLAMARVYKASLVVSSTEFSFPTKTNDETRFSLSRVKLENPHKIHPLNSIAVGYNPNRHEFDVEYDNDAELSLADMEFNETDTQDEHELKIRMLHIYSNRLDERKRRKDFVVERKLIYPNPLFNNLSKEERELCRKYDVFMRFHSKEDHQELLKTLIIDNRIRTRIQQLEEARSAGCKTSAEAATYFQFKRKREEALKTHHSLLSNLPNKTGSNMATQRPRTDLNRLACPWERLLTVNEKQLCRDIQLSPPDYFRIQEFMTMQMLKGSITKKCDVYPYFQIEPAKLDRVFDMCIKKGFLPS